MNINRVYIDFVQRNMQKQKRLQDRKENCISHTAPIIKVQGQGILWYRTGQNEIEANTAHM